ncbi:uncharacterized protein MYCFIDRAFT_210333 [Pseudocercospora fijiensis CIRAD86]|uniref:Asl1-like glycosyl hydrolase catalytic domain-containing protein n=1 Tax=Pseudocercospora fijiensis (strain CIRAD86) TaxID=383855 RepID=M3B917_PSEFD|nr:uncharacterized protein MYCFIDRAFT_210333 [Pseudocercospora fijiensis CIRAD86]EME85822.1 hypothetical protein MYCFIDRAFT_210333 [Pseudocercospora fijiensis CIRAD86]
MSFNEPDLCGDGTGAACMSIQRCVTAYQNYMMPFNNTPGVRLGAPAVTDNGGLNWLQDFMGNCTDCHYDFINLHWYSNAYAFSYLQYYVRLAYSMFGMPIWITEFGMTSESYNTDIATQNFLKNATAFLDAVPYVERYSWFYDAPGYLINANGKGLSAQGVIYNSYTAPCPAWATGDGSCY